MRNNNLSWWASNVLVQKREWEAQYTNTQAPIDSGLFAFQIECMSTYNAMYESI